MQQVATRVAELLMATEAVGLGSAGIQIDAHYIDARPLLRDQLASAVADQSRGVVASNDTLVAPSTDALALVSLVSDRLGVPMAYIRQKAKAHGLGKQLEGFVQPGGRAVILSYQSPTSPSLLECTKALRESGASQVECILLADDVTPPIRDALVGQKVSLHALAPVTALRPPIARDATFTSVQPSNSTRSVGIAVPQKYDARKVARALLKIGAVTISEDRSYRLVSGLLSPIYTDNRLLISHPGAWRVVVHGLVDVLSNQVGLGSLDVLAGTATSGIPHAALLADRLSVPLVYADGSNGDWSSVRGEPRTGTRIVIVEDHVTTGRSVLESVALLRDRGARVDWCLAIFTYNMQRARERFEEMNLRLASLCDLNTLLDTAVEDGTIAASARSMVLDWVQDPQAWSTLAETRGLAPEHR